MPKKKLKTEKIATEIKSTDEKDYLRKLSKKNRNYLVDIDLLERERVARHIIDLYTKEKEKHKELCDKIDDWDETYRMVRKTPTGADSDSPNYVTPISTVTMEVIHANIINVFFTPKDLMRVLPVEENDIPKVEKLDIFGNWSLKNEMNIFEQTDRLFHSSAKNGECPYIVHWVKEYGTEIKRIPRPDPNDPSKNLIDPDTQQVVYDEKEEQKLLYNGPKIEILSRKDYLAPENTPMGETPPWEIIITRMNYDQYLREELQGHMYKNSIDDLQGWSISLIPENKVDTEGQNLPLNKNEKEFIKFFGRLRLMTVIRDEEDNIEDFEELEDEFIAIVNVESETLCSLRKNKFPLKMRPIGMDFFIPDDEGRRKGIGVMEFMDSLQKGYDAFFNQTIFGVVQTNNPFGFFSPTSNTKQEPIKIKAGYMFPTSDPQGVNIIKIPPPDQTVNLMLELIRYWAQMLFGVGDYAAGMESQIDPTAPAKKVEIVVAQGSTRLNLIIKRKNQTLCDIFKRWFLLYRENMPPNKFMRIAGDTKDNPWKFEAVSLQDFALKSIPDFELVGNILNVNKTFEANKKIAVYQLMSKDPFFQINTAQGIQAHYALTKWLLDGLEETGISRFLPNVQGEMVHTPEEENARFLQGDEGHPIENEDHIQHLNVHKQMLIDPTIPEEIKEKLIVPHIKETVDMMQKLITQQIVMSQIQPQLPQGQPNQMGGANVGAGIQRPPEEVGAGVQFPRMG